MMRSADKLVTDPDRLESCLATLPRTWVFTNGCFDILHRGHVTYLEEAAALGTSLIVGVNSDDSVRRLGKGADRPINPLEDRMAMLAALGCVALVVPFEQDTPLELILRIRPDHLVKGGDWGVERMVGAKEVLAYGGQVHSIPFRYQRSTTALLTRIRTAD